MLLRAMIGPTIRPTLGRDGLELLQDRNQPRNPADLRREIVTEQQRSDRYGVPSPEANSKLPWRSERTRIESAHQHLELHPATASSRLPNQETATPAPTTARAMATAKMILRMTGSFAEQSG